MTAEISRLAQRIDAAANNAEAIEQLSVHTQFSIAEAYDIQALSIAQRLQRGEKPVGVKMGFTSRVKMLQMGVDDLIIGRLTNAMQIPEGSEIRLADFVHPRVEPEIAFRLRKPLAGAVDFIEAFDAIDTVCPALEIIDSRYREFKFSLADVLADNCSSSAFVIGEWHSPDIAIHNLGIALYFNGRPVATGCSAAILGCPLRALVEAARLSNEVGIELNAGDIVLAGAATAAIELKAGISVHAEIQNLGRVGFSVAGHSA